MSTPLPLQGVGAPLAAPGVMEIACGGPQAGRQWDVRVIVAVREDAHSTAFGTSVEVLAGDRLVWIAGPLPFPFAPQPGMIVLRNPEKLVVRILGAPASLGVEVSGQIEESAQ